MSKNASISPPFFQRLAISTVLLYQQARKVSDQVCVSVFGVVMECKHSPSCSEYTIQSIKTHGTIKGSILGAKRILTCW